MEQVFSYIISLGASVMMPILFTIIGLCIGMKFGKSLKSGLYVGVGFVGLGIAEKTQEVVQKKCGWVVYKCVNSLAYIGAGVLTIIAVAMVLWNRKRIVADEKRSIGQQD